MARMVRQGRSYMSVYEHVLRLLTPAKEWTEDEKETVRLTPACIDVPLVLPRIYPVGYCYLVAVASHARSTKRILGQDR